MKKRRYLSTLLLPLLAGLLLFAAPAFAASRVDLVENGTVSVESRPGPGLYFHELFVHQEGSDLVVSGSIKRRKTATVTSDGHIDIAVIDPGGKVLEFVSTRYVPRVLSRLTHRGSYFAVHLPLIAPKGSVVRVARHKQVYFDSKEQGFDCGENAVVPM